MNRTHLLAAALVLPMLTVTGCRHDAAAAPTRDQVAERQHEIESARTELAHIPPPSKNMYTNVNTLDGWENPLLTVQQNMITINVMMPDANPSEIGKGTLLRPTAARKNVLNVNPEHLAQALNAIPKEAWPYGRVVAIEEAHGAPKNVVPQLRRNIEAAMQTLSDLGVVADEWNDQRPVGIR